MLRVLRSTFALRLWLGGVAALALPTGCGGADDGTEGQPVRKTTGEITKIDGTTVTIAHEKIEGFMEAMTMPFSAPDAKMVEGLKVGDRVAFSFQMNREGKMILRSIDEQ
jgi:Cu/Ag efflux protein CusF